MESTSAPQHTPIKMNKLRKKILKFINEPPMQLFMGALLMVTLFLADSYTLGNTPDSQNDAMYSVLLAIFVLFNLEMFVLLAVQDGYFGSFFFFLDLLGNFSIILDIDWIAGSFIPDGTVASQGSVVRAARAAKLGARYGRLLRIMRFMRLLKFLPCLKDLDTGEDFEPTMSAIKKVSDELSNVLSLRTAALVLILVIVVPFLSYTVTDHSADAWITNLKMLAKNETTSWAEMENAGRKIANFYRPKDADLLSVFVDSPYFPNPYEAHYQTRDVLRKANRIEYDSYFSLTNEFLLSTNNSYAAARADPTSPQGLVDFEVTIVLDGTTPAQQTAMFNVLIIVLVIVVLFGFTASFNEVVNGLVVKPLEKMMTTLRNSAMVMLQSMKAYETATAEEKKKEGGDSERDDEDEDDEELETAMLERMVEKLARIVKHVLPGAQEIMDENIDKNTANWLNQSYTTGPAIHNAKEAKAETQADEAADKLRLRVAEESVPMEVREQLSTWDFDVLEHSNEELSNVMHYLFVKAGVLEEFHVSDSVFRAFLSEMASRYLNNTYHNYKHGVDVCFTAYRLMVVPHLTMVFTSLELFAVMVGALAHDVGHPGVNNLFLVKSKHELAMQHNDRSPLENMHCVVLYDILSKDSTNIFSGLNNAQWRETRKVILTIILGTDMSHHFEQISKTQLFFEVNGDDTRGFCSGQKEEIDCFKEEKNRLFIMELVLHCSDISNPFKPYSLCSKWADLVVEEFCLQGDKEKSMGLEISPMCDRETINLCNMQMGFIEFVVAPLIIAFVNVLPPLHEIGSNMLNNFQSWGEKRKLEIMNDSQVADKSEECRKLDERLGKFRDKMNFLNQLRDLPVRRRNSLISL